MFTASLPLPGRYYYTAPPISATGRIATSASLYDVLGVSVGATRVEIKAAYRRLARVVHPDVRSDSQDYSSTEEFMKVHAAYSTLVDINKRAEYDRSLFQPTGYSRRTWETDQCW